MKWLDQYNVIWATQSKNSGESMPVSGGDIGLNVWVENDEMLLYIGRAGYRDENGALLKAGRVRIRLSPNPFPGADFKQELRLSEGCVVVSAIQPDGGVVRIEVWIEVHRPVVHLDIHSDVPITAEAAYESWRFKDIALPDDPSKHDRRGMCMNFDAYPGEVYLYKDVIRADEKLARFYHRVDNSRDCFDFQVRQQDLEAVREQLVNPLENLIWGGAIAGDNMSPAGEVRGEYAGTPFRGWQYISERPATAHRVRVCLHIEQTDDTDAWDATLQKLIDLTTDDDEIAWERNRKWWSEFWGRSHLVINSGRGEEDPGWRIGRNYQLFRYMLAGNINGREPTIFNGGLFTFDPLYVNGKEGPGYTPDHRQWGALFTAQNQRMLVWPMLKTGDFDIAQTGFTYNLNGLANATARVRRYWNHDGCAFEEQSSLSGMPAASQYGFVEGGRRARPRDTELGVQVNHAGGLIYEGQLEYAWLMLEYCRFAEEDVDPFLDFIEQAVIFYDEHYRFRCSQRTGKELDDNGMLAIYPANTLEHHWHARNPTSVIAGLRRILGELSTLPDSSVPANKKARWQGILETIPEMPAGSRKEYGGTYLKPAENFEHESWHCPEMYPLFPYQLIGIGQGDLGLMERTSIATGPERREYITWKQANIHAPRLGDIDLAKELNTKKMDNGPYRFPAFWPHDVDWAPDHNWGGSGMIGIQEMVMQTHALPGERGKIRILPAWPEEWDVDFKLHAPCLTVVVAKYASGKLERLSVIPKDRQMDVVIPENGSANT